MAKLTKAQAKSHSEACALIDLERPLTGDEKEFVARNWNEAANHVNTLSGAHFTPIDMALDFSLDVWGGRVLDLCAGIGLLGLACVWRRCVAEENLVCVELNPDYIAVGKRLLPKATWICADAFALDWAILGRFDTIISNPPFGKVSRTAKGPRYTGSDFELCLMDMAADHADRLVFIVPQMSSPFKYSGRPHYERLGNEKTDRFFEQTGLFLECSTGIDTSIYKDEWKTTSIVCEVVCCETEDRVLIDEPVVQADLFGSAA